jgi:hypothetical protein
MKTKATVETDRARQTVNQSEETESAHPRLQSTTTMSVAGSGVIIARRATTSAMVITRNVTVMRKQAAVTGRVVHRQTRSIVVAAATRTSIAPRALTATAAGNIGVATALGRLQAETNTTMKTHTRATAENPSRVLVVDTEPTRTSRVIVTGHAIESAIVIDATGKTETKITIMNARAIDPETRQRTGAVVGNERQRTTKWATTMTGTALPDEAGETATERTATEMIATVRNVTKKTATTRNPNARLRKM